MAFNQWGSTIYKIMLKLAVETGDPDIRSWFKKTMEGRYDDASGGAFTPLERFVMELFRTISPNSSSISTLEAAGTRPFYQSFSYVVSPHAATSLYPGHWQYPEKFDPDRFKNIPTSHQVDEGKCEQTTTHRAPAVAAPATLGEARRLQERHGPMRETGYRNVSAFMLLAVGLSQP